jgi:hypothetical protein
MTSAVNIVLGLMVHGVSGARYCAVISSDSAVKEKNL